MLILTRKVGEKIVIAGGITIAVSQISNKRVKLMVEAPADVRVVRSEILHGGCDENRDDGELCGASATGAT